MKILSICIPTYNRHDCLKQCLESIISQSVFPEIEVVISDNASSDGTDVLIQSYLTRYPNIIYSQNKENLGFDRNMLQVVSLATSQYCLFIGDDDAFFDESLTEILPLLKKWEAEYYITNNWWYDTELKNPATLTPNLAIEKNEKFSTLKEFVISLQPDRIKTVGFFGGMSWQIFLREKWDNFPQKEQFIGSQTIHLFVLLHCMKEDWFMLIAHPTIRTRADNIRWDTFHMTSRWKREKTTLESFQHIALLYDIPYSLRGLYIRTMYSYTKNTIILFIKRYILRDTKKILKIKTLLSSLITHS